MEQQAVGGDVDRGTPHRAFRPFDGAAEGPRHDLEAEQIPRWAPRCRTGRGACGLRRRTPRRGHRQDDGLGFFGEHLLDRHGRSARSRCRRGFEGYPTRDQLRDCAPKSMMRTVSNVLLGSTGNGHVTGPFQRKDGNKTTRASAVRAGWVERRERQQGTESAAGSPLLPRVAAGRERAEALTSADAKGAHCKPDAGGHHSRQGFRAHPWGPPRPTTCRRHGSALRCSAGCPSLRGVVQAGAFHPARWWAP